MRKKTGKRIICAILIICTALCITLSESSCAPTGSDDDNASIKILCTLFPQYDWIRSITKGVDGVEVSLIIANGTDPHSYQPTAADIMNISKYDALVYVGGNSDTWVKKAIERSKNKEMKLIALTELKGIRLHDISSSSHSHKGHSHEGHSHKGHSHSALDEHLYLSLENAITSVKAITEWLCEKDEENAERYNQNASEYILKLTALGNSFKSDVEQVPEEKRFILFADRFPFVYLLSDYGIHYSAAFEGCTTDVDADFDTVIRLIHEANEHNVEFIAVTEGSDKSLASTVISSTNSKNQEIIVLNSLQSITQKQIEKGATYLSLMEENIKELKRALGIKN